MVKPYLGPGAWVQINVKQLFSQCPGVAHEQSEDYDNKKILVQGHGDS